MPFKFIRGLASIPKNFSASAITIGNFDGVHLGHQALIMQLIAKAKRLQLPSVLITFEPQPNEFFSKAATPPRLMRLREKLKALQNFPLDYVLCLRFNEWLAGLPAKEFVQKILTERLNAKYILVGDDFRFGHLRTGDIEVLKTLGEELGFAAEAMQTFVIYQERVSSSRVRHALQTGNLELVKKLLGDWYGMSGRVGHGDKRGRNIGFPTANILLHRKAVPLSGVFAVKTYGLLPNNQPVYGVANIGTRPTVGGTRSLLEVHLFNFNREIYGQHIYVEFIRKQRDEKRYDTFDLLRAQILKDAEEAKQYFEQNP